MTSPRPAPADAFAPGGRLYTVAEANRALPYVRRVVEDLVRDHARWRRCLAALDADRRGVPRPDDPDAGALGAPDADPLPADPAALRRLAARLSADVHAWLGELAALGVECKGMDVGLVDFPALVGGRPAYLCWQRGEPEVAWWHRPSAGYAGRRPLAELEPRGVGAPAGGPGTVGAAAGAPAARARP